MQKKPAVLVTGGTGVLGSAVVRAFLASGYSAISVARGKQSRRSGSATATLHLEADLTDELSVTGLFSEVTASHGVPDAVVHTAGGFRGSADIASTTAETWDEMLRTNLRASFLVLRESLRHMRSSGSGRIVLVSALSAVEMEKGSVAYKVSKAGVLSLVRSAADECRGTSITINGIAPLIIDTPENRASMPKADRSSWTSPDDIAASILYLCSPSASRISGSILQFR